MKGKKWNRWKERSGMNGKERIGKYGSVDAKGNGYDEIQHGIWY